VVNQFLRKWTNSSSFRRCSPPRRLSSLARSAPPACRRRRAALVPGPSASALASRRRCRAGFRPWPVGVRPHLPSAPPCVPSSSRRLLSLARRRPPSPAAVVVAPALVPGPSASALACRQRPLACRSRCAGSRPLPVSVRPHLPSSSSLPPPPTAADAPDRPSLSLRRASFHCFVCVVISRN
jgi:hypothetical protein